MNVYITVAAKRIQDWIVRTPRLKLLRGASFALQEITTKGGAETLDRVLAANPSLGKVLGAVSISDEAPTADGVIAMQCKVGNEKWAGAARGLIDAVVAQLQSELPGIECSGWAAQAENYALAHRAGASARQGVVTVTFPAADIDLPFAESCGGCGLELVEDGKVLEIPWEDEPPDPEAGSTDRGAAGAASQTVSLGPDCARRLMAFEERSQEELKTLKPARSFYRLAGLGVSPAGDRNHLAVIQADGNRVGALFTHLQKLAGVDSQVLNAASKALPDAMDQAVCAAKSRVVEACARTANTTPGYLDFDPVQVLYSGGDDLLAVVPARLGWDFASTLGTTFGHAFRTALQKVLQDEGRSVDGPLGKAINEVSLGIGMVFAHHSHPFAQSYRVSSAAMKQAKGCVQGKQDAVTWVDLTVEQAPPPGRYVLVADVAAQLCRTKGVLGTNAVQADTASVLAVDGSQVSTDGWALSRDAIVDEAVQTLKDDVLIVNDGQTRARGWTNSRTATVAQIVRDHWAPKPADPAWTLNYAIARERSDNRTSTLDAHLQSFSQARGNFLWSSLTDEKIPPAHEDIRELNDLINRRRWWPSTAE